VLFEELRANHRMGALRFMVQRLTDVVEETHATRDRRIHPHLRRHHAHQVRDFD